MRQAWILPRTVRRWLRLTWFGTLALGGTGCYQYYYCTPDPGCGPTMAVPSTVRTSPMCDVPTESVDGATKVTDSSTRSTTIAGGTPRNTPRVVVSQPSNSSSRFSWQRTDPDGSTTTTSVQGAISDPTVNK